MINIIYTQTLNQVKRIMLDVCPFLKNYPKNIYPDTLLGSDLDLDKIDIAEIIVELECYYNIKLYDGLGIFPDTTPVDSLVTAVCDALLLNTQQNIIKNTEYQKIKLYFINEYDQLYRDWNATNHFLTSAFMASNNDFFKDKIQQLINDIQLKLKLSGKIADCDHHNHLNIREENLYGKDHFKICCVKCGIDFTGYTPLYEVANHIKTHQHRKASQSIWEVFEYELFGEKVK